MDAVGHAVTTATGSAISVTEPAAGPARGVEVPRVTQTPRPHGRRGPERRGAGHPSRAVPARAPRLAQLPYWFSVALVLGGLAWMWYGGSQRIRGGTLALAGAMFIAAFARLVLPETWAGLLASRRRLVDVVVLAGLGVGLLVTSLVLPAPM
ncbi:MAG TPA: DUF3017 domain-containing protein [Streptosporangiaceae bacterium]